MGTSDQRIAHELTSVHNISPSLFPDKTGRKRGEIQLPKKSTTLSDLSPTMSPGSLTRNRSAISLARGLFTKPASESEAHSLERGKNKAGGLFQQLSEATIAGGHRSRLSVQEELILFVKHFVLVRAAC
jgi:hypothetical protein